MTEQTAGVDQRRWLPILAALAGVLALLLIPGRGHGGPSQQPSTATTVLEDEAEDEAEEQRDLEVAADRPVPSRTSAAAPATTEATTPVESPRSFDPVAPPATDPPVLVGVAPPASTSPTTYEVLTPSTSAAVPGPLRVVEFTWAQTSARVGTPLATAKDGTMPIANLGGSTDRAGFVRLTGTAAVLSLGVAANADDHLPQDAAISACPIISADWNKADGASLSDAPKWSTERCVAGFGTGGRWSFDLGAFADRGTSAGFALIPTPGGSTAAWQLSLLPS